MDNSSPLATGGSHDGDAGFLEDVFTEADGESDEALADSGGDGARFRPGDLVRAADRDNLGTVDRVTGDSVLVTFVNREHGGSASLFFPAASLTLERRARTRESIKLLRLHEILELPFPAWLIRGVLTVSELAVLYGPPAAGKSFVALHLSASLAAGLVWWRGARTYESPVLYVAAEGAHGQRRRLQAFLSKVENRAEVMERLEANFRLLAMPIPLMDAEEFEPFLDAIKNTTPPPKLIVLDTLARCLQGGDENSAKDMGVAIGSLERIKAETGATVLLVHHTGKDKSSERGSSALRAAADTMMRLDAQEGFESTEASRLFRPMVLACEKQKDGEPFASIDLELELGFRVDEDPEDGSPITSCRVREVPVVASSASKIPHSWMCILTTLHDYFWEDGATESKLLEASGLASAEVTRALFPMCKDGLIDRFKGAGGHPRFRLLEAGESLLKKGAAGGAGGGAEVHEPGPPLKGGAGSGTQARPHEETPTSSAAREDA